MSTPEDISKKNKYNDLFKNRTYFTGVGRRKTSIAQVRIYPDGKGRIFVNHIEFRKYFPHFEMQKKITKSLDLIKEKQNFDVSVRVTGGGFHSQADSISLGAARGILKFNPEFREKMKSADLLTRDSRIKERKKPGLKRARRAPQWQKR